MNFDVAKNIVTGLFVLCMLGRAFIAAQQGRRRRKDNDS